VVLHKGRTSVSNLTLIATMAGLMYTAKVRSNNGSHTENKIFRSGEGNKLIGSMSDVTEKPPKSDPTWRIIHCKKNS